MRLENSRDNSADNPANVSWNLFERTPQELFNHAGVGLQKINDEAAQHLLPKCVITDDSRRHPIDRPSPQRPYQLPKCEVDENGPNPKTSGNSGILAKRALHPEI